MRRLVDHHAQIPGILENGRVEGRGRAEVGHECSPGAAAQKAILNINLLKKLIDAGVVVPIPIPVAMWWASVERSWRAFRDFAVSRRSVSIRRNLYITLLADLGIASGRFDRYLKKDIMGTVHLSRVPWLMRPQSNVTRARQLQQQQQPARDDPLPQQAPIPTNPRMIARPPLRSRQWQQVPTSRVLPNDCLPAAIGPLQELNPNVRKVFDYLKKKMKNSGYIAYYATANGWGHIAPDGSEMPRKHTPIYASHAALAFAIWKWCQDDFVNRFIP